MGGRNPKDRVWGHRQNYMSGKTKKLFILFDFLESDVKFISIR